MLTLININRMRPPIGPIGLDYLATAARQAGEPVEVLDLGLIDDQPGPAPSASEGSSRQGPSASAANGAPSASEGSPARALRDYFARRHPELIGISLRNVDDCFWPSGQSFLPQLVEAVQTVRQLSDAPIVLGGVGFSFFPTQIVEHVGADFGIHGDGERALLRLLAELRGRRHFGRVRGLIWRHDGQLHANPPAWPAELSLPTQRDAIDNPRYFRLGGQGGVETKRGCNRRCLYCAEPQSKGPTLRLRDPAEVADEFEALAAQGVDCLHLCDSEFNIPVRHALGVCDELIRRGLDRRVRWYTYAAVVPFEPALAERMRRAGCVGINFTGDAGCDRMLETYRQPHRRDDLARTVQACRANGIAVMVDLLLGGPGETPESLAETIGFIKQVGPDCAGCSLGVRLYPGTGMLDLLTRAGPLEANPGLRRHYPGPVDLLQPTFYIAPALGSAPARLVREFITGDERFFPPSEEAGAPGGPPPPTLAGDHNYNQNQRLIDAIAAGARGAYWDILRLGAPPGGHLRQA